VVVVPFVTWAVYLPGARLVARIAASRLVVEDNAKAPTLEKLLASAVAVVVNGATGVPQLSLARIWTLEPLNKVILGSVFAPATLKGAAPRVGPTARISTFLAPPGPMTKPTVAVLPPGPTWARVERLPRRWPNSAPNICAAQSNTLTKVNREAR
jgi:hypothetical protein